MISAAIRAGISAFDIFPIADPLRRRSMSEQPHALDEVQVDKLHHVLGGHYVISGGFSFPSLHVRYGQSSAA